VVTSNFFLLKPSHYKIFVATHRSKHTVMNVTISLLAMIENARLTKTQKNDK